MRYFKTQNGAIIWINQLNFLLCRDVAAVVGSLYVVRLVWSHLRQLLGGFHAFFLALWGISLNQPQEIQTMGRWSTKGVV